MRYRDSASFGKRQEYVVVAELLRRGYDIYMTLVDDQGIDCIMRANESTYIDIQIKARSKTAKQWNFFPAMSFQPRKNYYFVFYVEKNNSFWVMPSIDVARLSIQNKSGANAGRYSLTVPKSEITPKALAFEQFKNDRGFDQFNTILEYGL